MRKKKNVWYIKEKFKRNKKKYKNKKRKGFGDGFKLLYSIGKQWRNSIR